MTTEICDICDIANCAHIREPKLQKLIAELVDENRRLRGDDTQDALLLRAVQEALEAAAEAISILPENGNAGPPQDNTDRLLDTQRRVDAAAIRAIDPDEIVKRVKEEGNG